MRDETKNKAVGASILGVVLLWAGGVIAFWVAVIWIVLHFVAKFW